VAANRLRLFIRYFIALSGNLHGAVQGVHGLNRYGYADLFNVRKKIFLSACPVNCFILLPCNR
jgi:hypothetical protein